MGLAAGFHVHAQERIALSGTVINDSTGLPIHGATIFIIESSAGTISDLTADFIIRTIPGRYTIIVASMGYKTDTLFVELPPSRHIPVRLSPLRYSIGEATISGTGKSSSIIPLRPGLIMLAPSEMKRIPSLMGESDPLRALRSLPGIQTGSETSGYLHVRGGMADQNLFLLDDAVLFNPLHLFGLFSIINPSVLQSVSVFKGGMPARFGGRLSSTVDMKTREGQNRRFGGEFSTGILATRILAEGPLIRDKASFLVAARRTHLDLLIKPLLAKSESFRGSGYYFYDLNGIFQYLINPKNTLKISAYSGSDDFLLNDRDFMMGYGMKWGNQMLSAKWQTRVTPEFIWNTSLIVSRYKFRMDFDQDIYKVNLFTDLRQNTLTTGVRYNPSEKLNVQTGIEAHTINLDPNQLVGTAGELLVDLGESTPLRSAEASGYIDTEFLLGSQLTIHAGLRLFSFHHIGPFTRKINGPPGEISDSIFYPNNSIVTSYHGIEPRVSLNWEIFNDQAIKLSMTHQYQPVHMVPFSLISLPVDIWVTSTSMVAPQEGTTYTAGWFGKITGADLEFSIEGYYRNLTNQVELNSGLYLKDYFLNNYDQQFAIGTGRSYGVEFLLKKDARPNQGWIAYTWSKSLRIFPDLNNGLPFYARHDRRHELNLVFQRTLHKGGSLSVQFVYASGQPAIIPWSLYFFGGFGLNSYSDQNAYRLPAYHRLDIGLTLPPRKKKIISSAWNFSVYNLYNRLNPFLIYYETNWDPETQIFNAQSRQVALLPLVPSITWTGRF